MSRDIQMRLVYAWERKAYPGYFDSARSLEVTDVRALVKRVHSDVLRAGGYAHEAPVVQFTKRNGSACAKWGLLKFTPGRVSPELALHEIAHALTWHWHASQSAMRTNADDPLTIHARKLFCTQGHGPRYVACFIALCERYAGHSADRCVELARSFDYEVWRMVHTGNGMMQQRQYVTKRGSVRIDMAALAYWRALLAAA